MALQLGRAVSDGIRRTFTRTGAVLFLLLVALQLGVQVTINSAVLGFLPAEAAAEFSSNTGLTLPVSGGVALALFVVTLVLSAAYFVVLSRTFAQPSDDAAGFPGAVTQRLGRATAVALVGGTVVSVAVTVGFALLVLPGLFLAASFMFFIFAVAVEDRGVIGSLKRSWGLAGGSRIKLGVLVVASALFGAVIGVAVPLLRFAGGAVAADLVNAVLTSAFFLPYYAVIASAYLQLRDGGGGAGRSASGASGAAAISEL